MPLNKKIKPNRVSMDLIKENGFTFEKKQKTLEANDTLQKQWETQTKQMI